MGAVGPALPVVSGSAWGMVGAELLTHKTKLPKALLNYLLHF